MANSKNDQELSKDVFSKCDDLEKTFENSTSIISNNNLSYEKELVYAETVKNFEKTLLEKEDEIVSLFGPCLFWLPEPA